MVSLGRDGRATATERNVYAQTERAQTATHATGMGVRSNYVTRAGASLA